MKKIICAIIILVASYIVICDGMCEIFNLAKVWQYMFNFATILFIIPMCVFQLIPVEGDNV